MTDRSGRRAVMREERAGGRGVDGAGMSQQGEAGSRGVVVAEPVAGQTPEGTSDELVLVARDVGKRFSDFQAVQKLSLRVARGGLVGLIGPSGCGKTTTVRLMLGVYEPSEGEIHVLGERPYRFRRRTRERIGYLPQHFVLYPTLTVDENLNFAAAAYGLGPFRRRRAKQQVLDLVGLTEHRRTLAGDISGGMQRRLALAATLLHQPELLFLDEPTAGIDPILREQLWTEFRRLQAAGRTQIVTTQYVTEAEYCDFVILMDAGQIVAAGQPAVLRREVAGGELIDATIPGLDAETLAVLRAVPGVLRVEQRSDTSVRVVSQLPANEVIPQIIEILRKQGREVQSIEERRLSFNEVFVALLERAGHRVEEVSVGDA